jgi:hypothetical protein
MFWHSDGRKWLPDLSGNLADGLCREGRVPLGRVRRSEVFAHPVVSALVLGGGGRRLNSTRLSGESRTLPSPDNHGLGFPTSRATTLPSTLGCNWHLEAGR